MKLEDLQNRAVGLASAAAFAALLGLVPTLAGGLLRESSTAWLSQRSLLVGALLEGLWVALMAVPPALVLGSSMALYWVEYREERMARLGRRLAGGLARLPELFVAAALVAAAPPSWREQRALLAFAGFVPALVFVATSTSLLLARLVPRYRGAALALGVARHHWILGTLRHLAVRQVLGIALLAFGRVLTATAPLLVVLPGSAHAPLPVLVLRDLDAPALAACAFTLLVLVLTLKTLGRALFASEPRRPLERA